MDAIKYLKEKDRMCKVYRPKFSDPCGEFCPLYREERYCTPSYERGHLEDVVAIVEQWSKEHPIKTNAMKFEEVFGFIPRCRDIFDTNNNIHHKPWWDAPYEAPKEE